MIAITTNGCTKTNKQLFVVLSLKMYLTLIRDAYQTKARPMTSQTRDDRRTISFKLQAKQNPFNGFDYVFNLGYTPSVLFDWVILIL